MANSGILFSAFFVVAAAVLLSLSLPSSGGAMEDDGKACAEQLQNLASCIPYVSGSYPKPAPECCGAAEKVRSSQPECLCVLIVESTSTSAAFPINTTLALQMPAACHSPAKVSDCPSILKLSPDSPDAKIFKDAAAAGTDLPSTSPATSSSISGSSDSSTGGGSSSTLASKSVGASSAGSVCGGAASLLMASMAVLLM